jgi:hypothetical protein
MIKTLRITSIIAAIAATVLLILPAVYGVRNNPKIEEFIKLPGAVDKFTAAKGQNPAPKNTESPLVKEALVLGKYLNPPPPPPPKAPPVGSPQGPAVPTPPAPVAVKFDLVATSYYASHPEKSFVLINEPGKGLYWVKQGSAVGHLTIETVKDGAIIVRDGQRTSEMTVKVQESWRKLLKNPPPETRPSSSSAAPASPAAQAPTSPPGPENPVQPSSVTTDKPGLSNPVRTGAAPMPTRINPRAGIIHPSERITSAAQPAPAIGQPRPAEPVNTPPASEVSQPPPPEPVVEPLTFQKETEARIQKLTEGPGSSKITGDDVAKLKKLTEELESPTLTGDESEAKMDELNALFSQLEKRKGMEQPAGPQSQSSSPSVSAAADANK